MQSEANWDLYRPEDADAVRAHHEEQERRIGRKMDLPDLNEKPVLLALVRRVGNEISHVIYLEAEAEVCALGRGTIPEDEWDKLAAALTSFLMRRKIRIARAFIPETMLEVERGAKRRTSPLGKALKRVGLKRDRGMAMFFRWLI